VKHEIAKRMVFFSVIGTLVAMAFMAVSILFPTPLLLVAAMSIGQGVAILALALFLLAVALDLQSAGETYLNLPDETEPAPAEEPPPQA